MAGGVNSRWRSFASAELYDPASGTWTCHGQPRHRTRLSHGDVAAQRHGAGGRRDSITATFSRARNCTTRRAGPGRATGSLNTARDDHTATLLPNGMVLVAGGYGSSSTLSRARNCTTRRAGRWTCDGQPQHRTRFSHGDVAAQRQGAGGRGMMVAVALSPARNCTTRRAGPGLPRAASTPHAFVTRRRCCPTARCWWQGDMAAVVRFSRARNCTTRPAGPGRPPAASTPHAEFTRRRCCPTARCWWQGETDRLTDALASAELYDPASGTWTCHRQPQHRTLYHTATLLPNGMVLVAGEMVAVNASASAELYDPASGTWTCDGQPQHRTLWSHGDVAAQRQGAGGRGIWSQ